MSRDRKKAMEKTMEAIGVFLLSALGSIALTVLFQDKMEDLAAAVLPGSLLVGNHRKFRGKWKVSYTKDGTPRTFTVMLKQINRKVWGTSEVEPMFNITYKLFGSLKGDKLSGV
jgi:hypothetical protein